MFARYMHLLLCSVLSPPIPIILAISLPPHRCNNGPDFTNPSDLRLCFPVSPSHNITTPSTHTAPQRYPRSILPHPKSNLFNRFLYRLLDLRPLPHLYRIPNTANVYLNITSYSAPLPSTDCLILYEEILTELDQELDQQFEETGNVGLMRDGRIYFVGKAMYRLKPGRAMRFDFAVYMTQGFLDWGEQYGHREMEAVFLMRRREGYREYARGEVLDASV